MAIIIKPIVTEKMTAAGEKFNRYGSKAKQRYTKTGLLRGEKAAYKKAIVTLHEGETIDFYSNI